METKGEKTKFFIEKATELLDAGKIASQIKLAEQLAWSDTALNSALKNRRSIPEKVLNKFIDLYRSGKFGNNTSIPVYELRLSAGDTGMYSDDTEIPSFSVSIPGFEDCNFGMYVYGHSMEPAIEDGSLLLCKKIHDKEVIQWGEIYVILTGDYRIVKRVLPADAPQYILCVSDNEEHRKNDHLRYAPLELERDKIRDLYLVKGIIKKTQS